MPAQIREAGLDAKTWIIDNLTGAIFASLMFALIAPFVLRTAFYFRARR